jgi:hypothetical protein
MTSLMWHSHFWLCAVALVSVEARTSSPGSGAFQAPRKRRARKWALALGFFSGGPYSSRAVAQPEMLVPHRIAAFDFE